MVLIREFRIILPFSMDEYRTGQKYSVARASRLVTKGADGVEVRVNQQLFDEQDPTKFVGTYTDKVYHMDAYLPGWIKKVLPSSATRIFETATDKYPHCKTVCTFPFLGDRFELTIESRHAADRGETVNIHGLSGDDLKRREIIKMDFAADQLSNKDQQADTGDPRTFKSVKSGRGPLAKGWQKTAEPVMCAYKLVTVRCKVFALQSKLEKYLIQFEHEVFLRFHKQLFCWQDDWWGMTHDQLVEYENQLFEEMGKEIHANFKDPSPAEEKVLEEEVVHNLEQLALAAPPEDADANVEDAGDSAGNDVLKSSS
jgi:hypothetical protein